MYCVRKIKDDTYWVGGSDRRLALFENVYPIPEGISYNAYLVMDEKTVLIDAVDKAIEGLFFENVEHVLAGRPLDYLIVNHMEPDHGAAIGNLFKRYPHMKIVTNSKSINMIRQFFTFDIDAHSMVIKEGDTLETGRHAFTFVMAPMVHWPETMVTYDTTDRVLYSGDAFGTFGALNGNLFADEMDFPASRLADARRYYSNIVGKYGSQVQALLKKARLLEISLLCPLHGPVWRNNIDWYIQKYEQWSTYVPEDNAVMILFGSIYGNTENAADILASALAEKGHKKHRDVRRVLHAYVCACSRGLPLQPHRAGLLHVQRGDIRAHAKPAFGFQIPQSPKSQNRHHGKRNLDGIRGQTDDRACGRHEGYGNHRQHGKHQILCKRRPAGRHPGPGRCNRAINAKMR
jgi:flavorubredoxin